MKAIVFDLDDTLVRWRGPQREAVTRTVAARPEPIDAAIFAATVARTWTHLAHDLNTGRMSVADVEHATVTACTAALRLDEQEARHVYAQFLRNLGELVVAYEDTAVLTALSGRYRLGVATNGPGEVQREKLRRAGLLDAFDFVVCSTEIGIAKPDPAFYDHVQRAARAAANEILVVGNNVALDLVPAVEKGMRAVWVVREEYGPQEASWTGPTVSTLYELETLTSESRSAY